MSTCQQYHPNASDNFSDAWLGHYPPTMESHPAFFLASRFYDVASPLVVVLVGLLLVSDVFRRLRQRFSGNTGA
ncbi:MAG: hypothetical protein HXY40_05785 [Chloroflexi bacterium]|nr:hypothetical protein [Chloroflexota bacterium]